MKPANINPNTLIAQIISAEQMVLTHDMRHWLYEIERLEQQFAELEDEDYENTRLVQGIERELRRLRSLYDARQIELTAQCVTQNDPAMKMAAF